MTAEYYKYISIAERFKMNEQLVQTATSIASFHSGIIHHHHPNPSQLHRLSFENSSFRVLFPCVQGCSGMRFAVCCFSRADQNLLFLSIPECTTEGGFLLWSQVSRYLLLKHLPLHQCNGSEWNFISTAMCLFRNIVPVILNNPQISLSKVIYLK